ncbi:MAG TPA: hypothetical protein VGZ47_09560 [Gemmataceae bacterium]|jgi:hypothetical protein|nr:hypothetical protein [Gemmataceae bacterium]
MRTGKKTRSKTAIKGKRYRCAMCHKRSAKSVKTPAPWYCAICARILEEQKADRRQSLAIWDKIPILSHNPCDKIGILSQKQAWIDYYMRVALPEPYQTQVQRTDLEDHIVILKSRTPFPCAGHLLPHSV